MTLLLVDSRGLRKNLSLRGQTCAYARRCQ
jgi:hypothetical protein